jgi:hypothetical protein
MGSNFNSVFNGFYLMKFILLFKIYLNVSLNNKFLNLHLTVIYYSLNLIKSTIIYIELLVEF